MTLRTTQNGLDLIRAFEGEKLKAYRCPAGVWTIGVGHTSAAGAPKVTAGMVITKAESAEIFRRDIDTFEDGVERLLAKAKVNVVEPCEFDAMVSLAFNIGLGAFKRSTVLARYLRGDKAGAAAAFAWWNKVKGVAVAGLTRRRKAETALFRGETSVALAKALDFNEPMPQRVDAPTPPKTMAKSKTGNAAIGIGVASIGSGVAAVREASYVASEAREAAAQAVGILGLVDTSTALIVGLSLIVVAAAAFIWWDRRRRLREDMA